MMKIAGEDNDSDSMMTVKRTMARRKKTMVVTIKTTEDNDEN